MVAYKTVRSEASNEFIERRSRFIGYAKPVTTEDDAISFIHKIKSKNWNATHNVYAYAIREGQIKRYSDDGEPQGTAGIPVLDVILKSEVTNVVIVTTRYFGGVLLGTGGLVRAYSHSASIALEQAQIVTMQQCKLAELTCDYNQYGRISALIPDCSGFMDDTAFGELVKINFHMSETDFAGFEKQLADDTCGQVQPTIIGEKFFAV